MRTVVRFTAGGADYCLPVEQTRSVRTTEGLVGLPDARADVAGVVAGQPPLTVLAPLGGEGRQILVVDTGERTYGLLVDAVTGLERVADDEISESPGGQDRPLVRGTLHRDDRLVLVADAAAIATRL